MAAVTAAYPAYDMPTLVHDLARQPSDRPAVRHGGRTTSFGDLAEASERFARHLIARHGVGAGERVALLMEPGPAFVAVLYAIWRARAAAVVLTPLHAARERAAMLAMARCRLVIASPALEAEARASDLPTLVVGSDLLGDAAAGHGSAARSQAPERLLCEPEDVALVVFTSGTTSTPKGVVLRHRHVAAQCAAIVAAWGLGPDDVLVHVLPLHHVHGLIIAMASTLHGGGTVHLLGRFHPDTVLAACREATVLMGVPTMYARLVEALDASEADSRGDIVASLRRLRLCTSGSAALPVTLGERWAAFAGSYPVERFGMTELGVALSNPLHGERVPGSVGRPLPGVRVRVLPDGDDPSEGELLVAGPTVFDEYLERPLETAEAFLIEGDGMHRGRWFRTGDTARLREDGIVRILGRTSVDILKSGGYKLSAPEIEEALRRHPAVRDAAVVGLPDETYGQRVAAAVILNEHAAATPDEILEFLRGEIALYKLPRLLRIVDDVPRNALGKVLKGELVRRFAAEP